MSARRAAALVVVVAVAWPTVAAGETAEEVQQLAAQAAAGDDAALTRLREVTTIDGREVDLATALAGTDRAALVERLDALGEAPPSAEAYPDPAGEASGILSEGRYREHGAVRPLRGVLEWFGDKLRPLERPVEWLADRVPGGGWVLGLLFGIAVVAAAAFVAARIASRRARAAVESSRAGETDTHLDPAGLEREADAAERRGELELALRLRFRAGLVRLARLDAIPGDERTSGELRRILAEPEFDRLAAELDGVAYGRRAPTAEAVAAARAGWRQVLERAAAR